VQAIPEHGPASAILEDTVAAVNGGNGLTVISPQRRARTMVKFKVFLETCKQAFVT